MKEESTEEKPGPSVPKKSATKKSPAKKTKPPLNPSALWWAAFYKELKEDKGTGTKKRKLKAGTSLEDMANNSNSTEARAARGEIKLVGPIEATNIRDKAITRMTGPNPGRGDVSSLRLAIQSFGPNQVKPDSEGAKWKLVGIKSSLFNHQIVGVSMMLSKEFKPTYNTKGGILGDEMGLGKTVETIAMMRCNRPSKFERQKKKHITLIVCPAAAAPQWIAEIKKHEDVTGFDSITQYKHRSFETGDDIWKSADVVVVTYNELASAYPTKEAIQRIKSLKFSPEDEKKAILKHSRQILKHPYYRVVLDEGHAIKNYKSTTSKACLLLSAKYKWILTGTPMHNSSEGESIPRSHGMTFSANPLILRALPVLRVSGNRPRSMNNALKNAMVRRHVNDKFLGNDILQIPQLHPTEIVRVELPDAERLLFKQIEDRYSKIIAEEKNLHGTSRTVLRAFILLAIARLRQIISHPYLLEGVISTFFTSEDFTELEAKFAAAGDKIPSNSRIRKLLELERGKMMGHGSGPSSPEGSMQTVVDADPLGRAAMKGEDIDEALCGLCKELPEDLVTTKCNHIFCRECLANETKMNGRKCPECDTNLDESDPSKEFKHDAEDTATTRSESQSTVLSMASAATRAKGKGKGKGKMKREKKHGEDELFFQPGIARILSMLTAYDREYEQDNSKKMVDGAKVLAVKKHILKWQTEAPDDKIIAFTQHCGTGAILGRVLAEENIQFVHFWGDISIPKKGEVIKKFFEDPNVKVMIASLKCGGQALNITCANRVIIIDPWWNAAMEKQAFGRVARIGQQKETYLAKFVADETIEVDMVNLQEKKIDDIAKTLQESAPAPGGTAFGNKLFGGLIGLQVKSQMKAAAAEKK
ncbi:P-loop containing nucleoside triphosphate hydrolase protein [Rhypophila decipiens]|uniref:P-loop containing nucleoside triphosphate hydrolase protein n=1 Tax=Rhypophila decipiens TaxID=261697 RepID=A0AAN6Y853_9PEZI|nr:P-loop containing nucleoside triphosphate hydrolase protein [Rhypophila decipiens]